MTLDNGWKTLSPQSIALKLLRSKGILKSGRCCKLFITFFWLLMRSVLWCEAMHNVLREGLLYSKFADAMKGDH